MSLWRKHMDSSHLAEPRTLVRVYVEPGELDGTIEFYEKLLGVECDMYTSIPPDPADPRSGLTLATGGSRTVLAPCTHAEALQPVVAEPALGVEALEQVPRVAEPRVQLRHLVRLDAGDLAPVR